MVKNPFQSAKDKVNFLKGKFDFSKSMLKLAVDTITPMGLLSERLDQLDLENAELEKSNVVVTKQAPWLDLKQNAEMFKRAKAFQEMYSEYMRQRDARDKCVRRIYHLDPEHPILNQYDLKHANSKKKRNKGKDKGQTIEIQEKAQDQDQEKNQDKEESQGEDEEEQEDNPGPGHGEMSLEKQSKLMFYLEALEEVEEGLMEMGKHLEECKHHMVGFSFEAPPVDNTILVSKPIQMSNSPYILASKDQAKDIEADWEEEE